MATVAEPLGLTPLRAAWGIHETINEDIARAFRIHAVERGFDCRRAVIVAFGGGGPIHAAGIARKLRASRVVFPMGAGVMSALGLLASPMLFETARSDRVALDRLTPERFAAALDALAADARAFLAGAGLAPGRHHHRSPGRHPLPRPGLRAGSAGSRPAARRSACRAARAVRRALQIGVQGRSARRDARADHLESRRRRPDAGRLDG